jgi:hypothetical protein
MIIKILDYVRQGIFIAIFFFMCFSFGYFCYNPSCQGTIIHQKGTVTGMWDLGDNDLQIFVTYKDDFGEFIDVPRKEFNKIKLKDSYIGNKTKEIELPIIFKCSYICGIISSILLFGITLLWLICGSHVFTKKWWYDNF